MSGKSKAKRSSDGDDRGEEISPRANLQSIGEDLVFLVVLPGK